MKCPKCKVGEFRVLKGFVAESINTSDRRCTNPACKHRGTSVTVLYKGNETAYALAKRLRRSRPGELHVRIERNAGSPGGGGASSGSRKG